MWCWTFYKVKCSAQQNVTNAFDAKMHFGCAKMHLMQKCIWCVAKMYFCIKCIWCKNAFLRTFSKGKCSATLCKNAFLHHILLCKMFSITFSKGKCIWCKNAFDALQKCIFASNAFWRTFSKGKCSATLCKNAFLHQILLCKMFSITFSFGKCSAPTKCTHLCFLQSKKHSIFANQNVRKRAAQKTANTAFLHRRHTIFIKSFFFIIYQSLVHFIISNVRFIKKKNVVQVVQVARIASKTPNSLW